jgi:alanyl-tRNA synthetase
MTSNEIRQQFLDFFRSKEHAIVPSSPVVPHDDPTLMFTNAGMNQFKPIFLGTVDRNSEFGRLKRAANTQKCIRAGGKHNDLDDVGQDTYHHTFFEMLGNWSFGDYFKKEAIQWAWELLTEVWGIDKTRLHATYFGGLRAEPQASACANVEDSSLSRGLKPAAQDATTWVLEPDYEARDLWASVTDIDPSHIHPGSMKDNFWEMGETGPCGPCSEIHIDLTPDKSGASLVNKGDARVIELWNLVFIQFNRGNDRKLTALPAKHVDTGMGFERLCAVLQGMTEPQASACATPADNDASHESERSRKLKLAAQEYRFSNYDTDVFTPIFGAIQKRTGAPSYQGTLPTDQPTIDHRPSTIMIDVSYRVIADHIRCLTFALTDGAVPSNEGRGYVLRRILRRAVRYGRQYMNMHEPFLCDLVEPLVQHMGDVFPELRTGPNPKRPRDNVKHVSDILRDEEASFLKTLDRGIKLFSEAAEYARRHHRGKISGEDAFKLHDTYGFPIDLTELMAEEQGLTIDIGEYERLMEETREKARSGLASTDIDEAPLAFEPGRRLSQTVDRYKYAMPPRCRARIIGYGGAGAQCATVGAPFSLATDRTCFYAEQGGQVSDVGIIRTATGRIKIDRVRRFQDLINHHGVVVDGEIEFGFGECEMEVDMSFRLPTMQNHTATHLLNWALREVLCPPEEREHPHVQQKGSLVDPEKTRFDFSHNKPVTDDELRRVEDRVREHIEAGLRVYTNNNVEVDQARAREITGLRAVFGEKYPDKVRVVSIGAPVGEEDARAEGIDKSSTLMGNPTNPEWMKYSIEFCGGTHVANTSEVEAFVLTHEEGVAKGVRRVVGISGKAAKEAIAQGAQLLDELNRLCTEPQASACATPTSEPQALACADSRSSMVSTESDRPRELNLAARSEDLPARVAALQQKINDAVIPIRVRHELRDRLTELQKIVKEQEKQAAAQSGEAVMDRVAALLKEAEQSGPVGGVTVVVAEVPAANPDALRGAIDWFRNKTEASAVLLACTSDGKVTLLAGMSKAVVDRGIKAGDLIKEIAPLVGGKGGGRPDMAQGGGTDASGLPNALDQAAQWIRQKLS